MPVPHYDPEIAALLADMPFTLGSLDEKILPTLRAQPLSSLEPLPLSDDVLREDHVIPGPPGAPNLTVRVHSPIGLAGPAPCLYSIHGGGYILGTRDMDDMRFDRWCPKFGLVGVSVEYRLAPETPYPGPLEDCYTGLQWVYDNSEKLGVDPGRIGIGGASAGGGLAAALALLCRDRGQLMPAFQMLIYPMLDDRRATTSSQWEVPIWKPDHNEFGWRAYLGPLYGSDDVPYLAAPARATDLSGLPPTLIYVGTLDGFCDEDVIYAMGLYHAGVRTELHVYPGAPHGFDGFAATADVSKRARHDTEEWLTATLADLER
jgi:acetyl esterase/lipase